MPIPVVPPLDPAALELARLRRLRDGLQAEYDKGGQILRSTVGELLAAP